MNTYKVSEQLLNKVLNYLANRPWAETNSLIVELHKVELMKEEDNVQEGK